MAHKKKRKTVKSSSSKKTSITTHFLSVYVTSPSRDVALKVAQKLVEEQLVACFNIFENVTSVYRWKNELEKSEEVVMIGKTKNSLKAKVIRRIRELNTYDLPCIVFWPITDGFKPYLDWVKSSTK